MIREIVAENNIQPNLLCNLKNEFLQNASIVFDGNATKTYVKNLKKNALRSLHMPGKQVS